MSLFQCYPAMLHAMWPREVASVTLRDARLTGTQCNFFCLNRTRRLSTWILAILGLRSNCIMGLFWQTNFDTFFCATSWKPIRKGTVSLKPNSQEESQNGNRCFVHHFKPFFILFRVFFSFLFSFFVTFFFFSFLFLFHFPLYSCEKQPCETDQCIVDTC